MNSRQRLQVICLAQAIGLLAFGIAASWLLIAPPQTNHTRAICLILLVASFTFAIAPQVGSVPENVYQEDGHGNL